jgi:hypothetical protein
MQHSTHIPSQTTSRSSTNVPLFRLTFVGGRYDGAEMSAAMLPANRLELASGPAGYSTRQGRTVAPRVARYRMQSLRLDTAGLLPVVSCRFEYFGAAAAQSAPAGHWWTPYCDAFWQWLEPRPRPSFVRITNRSIAHV